VSSSQLKGWVFDPRPLREIAAALLGKRVHPNLPSNKRISGFGLPPIAITKINEMIYIGLFSNSIHEADLGIVFLIIYGKTN